MTLRMVSGILISVAVHVAAFNLKPTSLKNEDVQFEMDSGTISVELTLMPSIASAPSAPEPEPQVPEPEPPPEPIIEKEIPIQPEPEIFIPIPAEIPADPTPSEPPKEKTEQAPEPETVEPEETLREEIPLSPSIESIEQIGTIEQDKGLLTEAVAESDWKVVYPRLSIRRNEEGTVVLIFTVNESGQATDVDIEQSSGCTRLDKAALKAVSKARFKPATQNGKPIPTRQKKNIVFRLND